MALLPDKRGGLGIRFLKGLNLWVSVFFGSKFRVQGSGIQGLEFKLEGFSGLSLYGS